MLNKPFLHFSLFLLFGVLLLPQTLMASNNPSMNTPRIFLWDASTLADTRARIDAGDPSLRPAYEKLINDASDALTAGPYSVMQKSVTPPSGDMHDYMSMGSYWWPNPKTPDGLPYIRKDGVANPENDKLDMRRLKQMGNDVAALALAWYFTGEERYAERAALFLRVWFLKEDTRMNPHLRYGQGIPGQCDGRGIGIIDTTTLTQVVDAAGLLEQSKSWTSQDQAGLKDWFRQYLDWLLTSDIGLDEARQPNNHGTWYDAQVASYALYLGDKNKAGEILKQSPARRIAKQIEPDGSQPYELARTKSLGYTLANLRGFFAIATLAQHVGQDIWNYQTEDGRGIRKAVDYIVPFAEGKQEWQHEQLGGVNYAMFVPYLRRAARAYDEPRYNQLADQIAGATPSESLETLLYPPVRVGK